MSGIESSDASETESSSDDEMANKQANVNPPSFIGPEKSFSQYKKDVKLWSRLTTVKPDLQAELIVYSLDGHKSGIKEKIQTQIGDSLQANPDGVDALLKFLEKIYNVNDMGTVHKQYLDFRNRVRLPGESVNKYITEWENLYHITKADTGTLPDSVLCFELLRGARLDKT